MWKEKLSDVGFAWESRGYCRASPPIMPCATCPRRSLPTQAGLGAGAGESLLLQVFREL